MSEFSKREAINRLQSSSGTDAATLASHTSTLASHTSTLATLTANLLTLPALKVAVVAGASAAATDIAVTGIEAASTVKAAILFTAGVPSDITSTITCTSGNIQSSGETGATNQILLFYCDPTP